MSKRHRDIGRKFESGSEKRKRKTLQDASEKKAFGSLEKFLATEPGENSQCSKATNLEKIPSENEEVEEFPEKETSQEVNIDEFQKGESEVFNVWDPGCWPDKICMYDRDKIVSHGPKPVPEIQFPVDEGGRRFSINHCKRHLPNGEIVKRLWLVYSETFNRIYCFCCKLFGNNSTALGLRNVTKWLELDQRLNRQCTIDKESKELIKAETDRWKNVVERLIAITQFLAEHNLAFRGSVDKLNQPHNGNFLGVVELLAKFDPVMQEHVRRIKNHETHAHYLGKQIQNELISLLSENIHRKMTSNIRNAKYFSVIMDCTPDLSHKEQLSLTIRYVSDGKEDVPFGIYEHFVGFVELNETTGESLFQVLLKQLQLLDLDESNIRGQGYDNGANMKGYKSSVQAKLLEINPRAFYMPCACHSYNLLLSDIAKTCTDAISFFGIIQRIYVLCTASTKRYSVFRKHVTGLTVKPLCETRWHSRIDSIRPIRYQTGELYDAILEIAEDATDPIVRSEAESLANELKNFCFLVAIVFWHDILFRFAAVSDELQSASADLTTGLKSMEGTCNWLTTYRETGFTGAITTAREIAESLEVEPIFKEKRLRKRKKNFDYEGEDQPILNAQESMRINFFNVIIDGAISSMELRFLQLKSHKEKFGFLINFCEKPKEELKIFCLSLEKHLTVKANRDIDGIMLTEELEVLKSIIPKSIENDGVKILEFLCKYNRSENFPNAYVSFRILLTMPITVASGERSFSKLKLIKTFLRTTMTEDRLNNLAIISIETDVARQLNYNELITEFVSLKACKTL